MDVTIPQVITVMLLSMTLGFTMGIIVMDIRFLKPMQKLNREIMDSWKHTIDLLDKCVKELPVKSPIQIKQD